MAPSSLLFLPSGFPSQGLERLPSLLPGECALSLKEHLYRGRVPLKGSIGKAQRPADSILWLEAVCEGGSSERELSL